MSSTYKPVTRFMPEYTYEFNWVDGGVYRGKFVRLNRKVAQTLLFKDVEILGSIGAFPARDFDLTGHSWINTASSSNLISVWEIGEPENNKPTFDKKDWVANLFASSLPRHGLSVCPKCGSSGTWVRTALVCKEHGVYAGF